MEVVHVEKGIGNDMISEIQRSIDYLIRFGQSMESLDSRFGRLNQRIDAMRSNVERSGPQGSERNDSRFQNQLQREVNDLLQGDEMDFVLVGSRGAIRGQEFRKQIGRIAETLDKNVSHGVQAAIDGVNQAIHEYKISPSLNLKRHLNHQIDLINNRLIKKIREQAAHQMNSILQEIQAANHFAKGSPPFVMGASAGSAVKPNAPSGNKPAAETDPKQGSSADSTAKKDNPSNPFNLHAAAFNTVRNMLAGKSPDFAMSAMNKAAETFQKTQTEMLKLSQSFMFKKDFQSTNPDGSSSINMSKVDAAVENLQSFIRQQSAYYGTDYHELYQVGNLGAGVLEDPVEIKKLIQLTAQLKTIQPGSSSMNIAKGLGSVKSQFGLEMADMQKQVVEPLAIVSKLTNTPVEQLLNSIKRVGSTMESSKMSPMNAAVLAGTAIKSKSFNEGNVDQLYGSVLKKLQSEDGVSILNRLGVHSFHENFRTGKTERKSGEEILQDLSKVLSRKGEYDKVAAYNSLFGISGSSKDAAAMHEFMNNFMNMNEAVKAFTKDGLGKNYDELLQNSLNNPVVLANRAQQKLTIAFDAIVQELTPSINQVSNAFINVAGFVERNAQLFARLGEVLSNVMIGMLMLKGIKWGAGKIGKDVGANFETERMRSGFLNGISRLEGTGLVGNDLKGMSRRYVGQLQKDPLLGGYVKEMHSMTEEQQKHFKDYLTSKSIQVKDLPTLFTAMEEAKNWTAPDPLSEDEKFDRHKQYNNRLATRPDVTSFLHPEFIQTMQRGTSTRNAYEANRRSQDYSNLSDRMTRMNPQQFKGFEDHLAERSRNGLAPIRNYEQLSQALSEFEKVQRQADAAVRQSSPTFGNLSNAVRGLNQELSRSQSMRNGFKEFLKDIPNLGRGAAVSIKNLAGGIGKLALEIASAVGLAEAGKSMMENFTSTDDQRKLNQADALDNNVKAFANTLRIDGKGKALSGESIGNMLYSMYGSAMNGISRFFGATESHYGVGDQFDLYNKMMSYYNFSGSMYDFAEYLKQKGEAEGKTAEDYVNEWYAQSQDGKETQKLREQAAIKQYEDAQLKAKEEEKLQQIAKESYEKKYKSAVDFKMVDEDTVKQRVTDKLSEVKSQNNIENLRALMNGMQTDSNEYIAMRKGQITKMRQVLNDELKLIDQYISNAKNIMETADPQSQQYKEASEALTKLKEVRKNVADNGEADILQEEYNQRQEVFQKKTGKISRELQKIDLISQAKELAAAYNMDTQSQAYLDAMKQIALNKINSMKAELANLKSIQALGDQSEEKALQILQLQNTIASEKSKIKEYDLASIGIGSQKLQEHNSERENQLLQLKLQAGNPDDNSPILRNKRIANAKSEVSEIQTLISNLKQQLAANIDPEKANRIQSEIRDLQKQSLQAQLGILDELKNSAGTFNLPEGVTAMTRYEYLTRQGTHNTMTVGMGDVTVNITLPNVTNTTSPQQLQTIGQGIGQGFVQGRLGNVRTQLGGNPMTNYRSRYAR